MMDGGFRQLADSDRRSRVGEAAEVWSSVHAPPVPTSLLSLRRARRSCDLRFATVSPKAPAASLASVHSLHISHPESGPVSAGQGL